MRDRRRISLIIRVEQEKFTLRTDIKPVAHLFASASTRFSIYLRSPLNGVPSE